MKSLILTVSVLFAAGALAAGPMCHPSKPPLYLIQGSAEWVQLFGSLE